MILIISYNFVYNILEMPTIPAQLRIDLLLFLLNFKEF